MAQIRSTICVPLDGHLAHDTDGKLLRMGHDVTGKVVADASLSRSSLVRKKLFKEAMCIRLKEKKD